METLSNKIVQQISNEEDLYGTQTKSETQVNELEGPVSL